MNESEISEINAGLDGIEAESKKPAKKEYPAWATLPVKRQDPRFAELWDIAQSTGAVVVGGFVRWMVSPLPDSQVAAAGDVDLFPSEPDNYELICAALLAAGYEKSYENDVCSTFERLESLVAQVIKPIRSGSILTFGSLESIISNFDFTVVRCGLVSMDEALVDGRFEDDEKGRKLVIKNIVCPVSSVVRIAKYARKGYFIGPGEAIKLFIDWDRRDDSYKVQLVELFASSWAGEMSQHDVDQLEALLRID